MSEATYDGTMMKERINDGRKIFSYARFKGHMRTKSTCKYETRARSIGRGVGERGPATEKKEEEEEEE